MLQKQQEILDIIERLVKIFEDLLGKDGKTVSENFQENKVISLIEEVEKYYKESNFQKIYPNAMAEILSVKASAVRVMTLAQNSEINMCKKLEFELLPLTENLRLMFYYYHWIGENPEKKKVFFEKEVSYYYSNRYLKEAKKIGKYKYEISIIVPAFNKLEVTKQCIESLKKYLPKDITYELILFNHGSSDGTKEYFESQKPDKQLDIEVNGGAKTVLDRVSEGKYQLEISNDILITENCIDNLYKCINSDNRIGWVVPSTPNVSNLQTIESNYKTIEEMYQFAKKNNVSNSDRWEEKPRLCNPVDIVRVNDIFEVMGKETLRPSGIAFPDDMISYLFRRKGYKMILAKDAYCYHFGSVTIGSQIGNQEKARINYCKGRISFITQFGMDPWGYGLAYDVALMNVLEVKEGTTGNILGINSGIGGNPLKIKSLLKEQTKIKNAKITYVTQYEMNLEDVKGLGDKAYKVQNWTECENVLEEKYDYILLENGIDISNVEKIAKLKQFLSHNGTLLVRTPLNYMDNIIKSKYFVKTIVENKNDCWLQIL